MTPTLSSMKKSLESLQETFKLHGREAVKTRFDEFFKAHPEVKSVTWTQYTPYFNDGDECHFNVYSPLFKGDGIAKQNACDWDDGYYAHSLVKPLEADAQALVAEIEAIPEVMLAVFGDHAKVTVTPDKITVDQYDHE